MKKLLATAAIAAASVAGLAATAGAASAETTTSGPVSGTSSIVVDTGPVTTFDTGTASTGIITSGPVSGSSSIVVDAETVGTDLVDPTAAATIGIPTVTSHWLSRYPHYPVRAIRTIDPTPPSPVDSRFDQMMPDPL